MQSNESADLTEKGEEKATESVPPADSADKPVEKKIEAADKPKLVEDEDDPYADIQPAVVAESASDDDEIDDDLPDDAQDNFVENREPAELMFCIILSAAYAGLARYCWEPLQTLGTDQVKLFVTVEGFFITISLLSLLLGLRPYLSPSKLQVGTRGVKYRGPYWPQRKTVNWSQMLRLYVSPQLIIALHRPKGKTKGIRFLIIQSTYLSDNERIVESFGKYAHIPPVYMRNPDWITKGILLFVYGLIIAWILAMFLGPG